VYGAIGYNASTWSIGRAPFGFGEDDRGVDYRTNFYGFTDAMRFRLSFVLTQADVDELSADNTSLRLSVASDDSARVLLNGQVVIAGNETLVRTALHYNDVVQLPPSSVHVGENVLAVLVYSQDPATTAFFELELLPQPTLDSDALAALNFATTADCAPGTQGCACLLVTDADGELSVCGFGLACDTYNNVCEFDWSEKWDPEEKDINDDHETFEYNTDTQTTVAGFCRDPTHICCVTADIAATERYNGHSNNIDNMTMPVDEATGDVQTFDPLLMQPFIGTDQGVAMPSTAAAAASLAMFYLLVALVLAL